MIHIVGCVPWYTPPIICGTVVPLTTVVPVPPGPLLPFGQAYHTTVCSTASPSCPRTTPTGKLIILHLMMRSFQRVNKKAAVFVCVGDDALTARFMNCTPPDVCW